MAQEMTCRPCWLNCGLAQADEEMREIDTMADALGSLDESTVQIRELITGFELCYHEAEKEAEKIISAIGTGQCPPPDQGRPFARVKALENAKILLSHWGQGPTIHDLDLEVEGIPARRFLGNLGKSTRLKVWQVQRIIDKINEGLNPEQPYTCMAFNMEAQDTAMEHFHRDASFLEQTRNTRIQDTVDGQEASISLAMAIDLLMPCHWDWGRSLLILSQAIGGNTRPEPPYTCCARNLRLSPLCQRFEMISKTLHGFWKETNDDQNERLITALGDPNPAKRWLTASLDKTMRLQLAGDTRFWLTFGQ